MFHLPPSRERGWEGADAPVRGWLQHHSRQRTIEIGLVEPDGSIAGRRRILVQPAQGELVGRGEHDQCVGGGVPVVKDTRMRDSEVERGVCCLRNLGSRREIVTDDQVEARDETLTVRHVISVPGRRKPVTARAGRQRGSGTCTMHPVSVTPRIAAELGVLERQVVAAVELLDGGATVPFIARYRKEVTGALDDAQLRTLEERLRYLREMEERRAAILESIRAQGKLDDALEAQIMAADSKARLEDIYLPYKPKRRTKAQIAREADPPAALDGARAILVERFAEDADLIGELRERMWSRGRLVSRVREGRQEAGAKFADYFDFAEPFTKLPSHRILAMFRGAKEEVLELTLQPEEPTDGPSSYEIRIAQRFAVTDQGRPADRWLLDTVRLAWRTRILVHLGGDLRARMWQAAEDEAARVFATNLRDLLLAAPAGARPTMGLDPGFRTGVKVAVVDATGKVVATGPIYPHEPARRW